MSKQIDIFEKSKKDWNEEFSNSKSRDKSFDTLSGVSQEPLYYPSKPNDNFMELLLNFIDKKNYKISDIDRIFVNLGPGKFTSLRISLSVAKAISLANSAVLVGFKSQDLTNKNYQNLIKLDKNKSLIKPVYSS